MGETVAQPLKGTTRVATVVTHIAITGVRKLGYSRLQVLFRETYWIRFWALLQKEEKRPPVLEGCRALECLVMEVFASNGWPFSNRIACV